MCWQGYAHFKCGHTTLHEDTCEYADQFDLPLWQKIQCPYYDSASRRPDLECGIGKFYCAYTHDGAYLDDIFRQNKHVDERIAYVENVLAKEINPKYEEIGRRALRGCGGDKALAYQRIVSDPQALGAITVRKEAMRQRDMLMGRKKTGEDTLNYARQFWLLHSHTAVMAGTPVAKPPLPPNLRRFPNPVNSQGAAQPAARPPAFPQAPQFKPPAGIIGLLSGGNASNPGAVPSLQQPALSVSAGTKRSHVEEQSSIPEVAAFTKQQRSSKKMKEEDAGPESTATVRRSTRATKKKINYAEDAGSEDFSSPIRPTSPIKSDASAFSPTKSDASASYVPSAVRNSVKDRVPPARATRGRSSLGAMIKDWSMTSAGTPNPGVPDSRLGTPETVILPMDDRREDAPINKSAPVASREANRPGTWLVNTANADPTLSPGVLSDPSQLAYGVPRGPNLPPNFTSGPPTQQPLMQPPLNFNNYPNAIPMNLSHGPATPLLRSGSAVGMRSNLGASPLVQYETPSGAEDPTKRQVPAPSPALRLSLPGEGGPQLGVEMNASTPSKLRKDSVMAPTTPPGEQQSAPQAVPSDSADPAFTLGNVEPSQSQPETSSKLPPPPPPHPEPGDLFGAFISEELFNELSSDIDWTALAGDGSD
ncbi:Hypothetical predicted protein [Lecanosticta acicola]|uniref:Uncharacterized protein n=1 Tax=Lecanosticta acicola TaxID=111012 RepID=A0AAI8Z1N3_9PEZI|nr:Hypothetical predicted protein [Lecanosticta acicola]